MESELSLEYVAGFIDGEGGFGIYPKQARMTVSNANRDVLERIRVVAGGGRIVERNLPNARGPLYELQIGSTLLRAFVPRVLPFLIVKRKVAELMIEYLSAIPLRNQFGYVKTPAEESRRQAIRDEIRAINESGGRIAWGAARGV